MLSFQHMRTFGLTFLARGLASVSTLLLAVLIGRTFSASGLGTYALCQSLLLILGTVSRRGLDTALMAEIGRTGGGQAAAPFARDALRRVMAYGGIAMLGLLALRSPLGVLFGNQQLPEMLIGIALALPAFSAAYVMSCTLKGLKRPAAASLMENGGISLLALALIWAWSMGYPIGLLEVGLCIAASAWLVLAWGAVLTRNFRSDQASSAPATLETDVMQRFHASSWGYLIANISVVVQSALLVMIAGYFLSVTELGYLKAAEQIAIVLTFIQIVMNNILPPYLARHWSQGNPGQVERVARYAFYASLGLAVPAFLIMVVAPELVLGLYGAGYEAATPLLRVLAIGQLVNVASGSVMLILNMTGHHRIVRDISIAAALISVILAVVLAWAYGPLGAAIAIAASLAIRNTAATVYVRRVVNVRLF